MNPEDACKRAAAEEVIKKGMEAKSKEFVENDAEVYAKAGLTSGKHVSK